jgi:uncharacterized protein YlxW (UPF0749 family)
VLGFALVVQTQATQTEQLGTLRQSDLVRILDNLNERAERLDAETRSLQQTSQDLRSGTDQAAAAERASRERLGVLGILAGTVPASGEGIELTITDPDRKVLAAALLNTIQELRDAGAEAIQIGSRRVVADTAFQDADSGVLVGGVVLTPPFTILAIGDSQTLASALDIPGGVLQTLRQDGARGTVRADDRLVVDATRDVTTPRFAEPSPAG